MQKFSKGDLVHIKKQIGKSRSHFIKDKDAIVVNSYAEKFGGECQNLYNLHIKNVGEFCWYEEKDFHLIEKNRIDLLKKWEKERKDNFKIKSDLDWIFNNGNKVLKHKYMASIYTLAKCIGIKEENVHYTNPNDILDFARTFLKKKDKEGYLLFSKEVRKIVTYKRKKRNKLVKKVKK